MTDIALSQAIKTVQGELERCLCENDLLIGGCYELIDGHCQDQLDRNESSISKCRGKMLSRLNREQTNLGNLVHEYMTVATLALVAELDCNEYLISQMACRCQMLDIGQPLETALTPLPAASLELQPGWTIHVSLDALAKPLADLLVVLREIRDAMGGGGETTPVATAAAATDAKTIRLQIIDPDVTEEE